MGQRGSGHPKEAESLQLFHNFYQSFSNFSFFFNVLISRNCCRDVTESRDGTTQRDRYKNLETSITKSFISRKFSYLFSKDYSNDCIPDIFNLNNQSTVLRHIFVHMIFVASVFEALYFMFKSYYMKGNLHQKKALFIKNSVGLF